MSIKKGRKGYLAISPGGVEEDDFSELEIVQNVTLSLTQDAADATARVSGGWKEEVPVQRVAEVTCTSRWDPTNTTLIAIRDAFLADDEAEQLVGVRAFDAATDSHGIEADMCVHAFTLNQPLDGIQTVDITLRPAPGTNPPEWIEPA